MGKSSWTNDAEATLRKMWAEGNSLREIGERLGISVGGVSGRRYRLGLPKRKKRSTPTKANVDIVLSALRDGLRIGDVARLVGLSAGRVFQIRMKHAPWLKPDRPPKPTLASKEKMRAARRAYGQARKTSAPSHVASK